MRRLTIALLSTQFWDEVKAGGSLSHITGVANGFAGLGHEVVYIGHSVPRGLSAAVSVHRVKKPPLSRFSKIVATLYGNLQFSVQAQGVLNEIQPDFIYQRYRLFDYTGPRLARRARRPFMLEFNSSEVWTSSHWGRLRLPALAKAIENANLRNASGINVVSEVLKRDLVAAGIDGGKVLVNPNGVDIDAFDPAVDGSKVRKKYGLEGKLIVGFVGTFGVWHGAPVLIEAVQEVVRQVPHSHFLLIGEGVELGAAKARIHDQGLGEHVTFAGTVDHGAVPEYLAACDILASPHVPLAGGKEFFGSPTKLFEYMAIGRAIVASDLGQIGSVLEDRRNALLIEPGDVGGLVNAIVELSRDESLRREFAARARKDVVQNYTWVKNAERICDFIVSDEE